MTIRQRAVRSWWRAKRALVRWLDRQLGTRLVAPPDTLMLAAGRALTVHVLKEHEYNSSLHLTGGDSFEIALRTTTPSGFHVPEPMVLIIDGFSPVNAADPYADRQH